MRGNQRAGFRQPSASSPRIASLAARVSRKFQWHWQPVTLADQPIEIATPTDPNELLIQACQRQVAANNCMPDHLLADPFWAQVWPSTRALDSMLDQRDIRGMPILELGCGTGAAGIAAALRGGRVTFTDGATEPLMLLRLTLHRQAILGCSVRRLIFAHDALPEKRFPLIIASDITYLRACWPGLHETLIRHLAGEGEVLLADPYRSVSTEFIHWATERGWCIQEHPIELPDGPIRIIQLRR